MPQRLNLLTDRRIRAIKERGRYTDGGGLVLQCRTERREVMVVCV